MACLTISDNGYIQPNSKWMADMTEVNNFLFITMPQETDNGARVGSEEVLERRLSENRWAVYSKTRNKTAISPGDNAVFYISNRKTGGLISATATIKEILKPEKNKYYLEEHGPVEYFLSFENLSKLSRPILFKSLLEQFTFCPQNKQKWGVALMGGIRRLNDTDYQLIKKQIQ